MRGGVPVVEEASGSEQVCAGADGNGATRTLGGAGDPVDDRGVLDCMTCSGSAGDQERVTTRRRLRQRVDTQTQPVLHAHRAAVCWPHHLDAVGAWHLHRRVVEDLDRAKHVERLTVLDG